MEHEPVTSAPAAAKDVRNHVEDNKYDETEFDKTGHQSVGLAVIEQKNVIPKTGKSRATSKWEYWLFCVFCYFNQGTGIGTNGAALRQKLISLQYPDGMVPWAGKMVPLNSMLLDLTGILFACQLFVLLMIGPYADYGSWRPWIMISFSCVVYICTFALIAAKRPDQWELAQVLVTLGQLCLNVVVAFFQATFPGIVRNLPSITESEEAVLRAEKTPEEHAKLDMYERAQLYNWINSIASLLVVITAAIAVGISAGIGFGTDERLIFSFRVLLGYYGAIGVLCSVPFFIVNKHRPGQQLPQGAKWYSAGPKQVWQAAKSAYHLKDCMLYLIAYFMLQETWGTTGQVLGILQNEVIHYSPLQVNALQLVGDLGGGSGTFFTLLLQRRYRFSIKSAAFYGACLTLPPSLWGLIGCYTHTIGFHHTWEFWLASAYNFATGCWGAYSVSMISEVVPAPKVYMFFALFNTVGKTSGFIGPLISSAIVTRAHGNTNYSFWFLFAMGTVGCCVLYFVNTDRSKIEIAKYLEREAEELYSPEQREAAMRQRESEHGVHGMATVSVA